MREGIRGVLEALGFSRSRDDKNGDGESLVEAQDTLAPGQGEIVDAQEERREMIRGVQELGKTTVKEVMVPRTDTLFVSIDAEREELLEAVISSGHSRIPIYRQTVDDVVGVLYAKDLLRAVIGKEEFSLPAILRKPFFVPETKRIDTLLREFKRRRVHIAIAVDEYGGVSGIICLEDIIEEIVGEIQDEFDEEREEIVELSENSWLCDARVNLADFCSRTGLELPSGEFDSLGGYVFDLFGRIPLRGETISAGSLDFTVQETEGHRIELVRVTRRSVDGGIS